MKFTCSKNELKEAVQICEKNTGKNLNLVVLSNILLDCADKILKLTATNLETAVEVEIPTKTEKEGKITIPGSVLSGFLSNNSVNEEITLESQNNNLIISTSNTSITIKGQPADDFPTLPIIKSEDESVINCADFVSGLKSVWYSCSNSIIKPEIASVLIQSNKSASLIFAATDSFRLAEKRFDYNLNNFGKVLLPFKSVAEILRIFDGVFDKLKIKTNKNQINIESDNIKFISRLIDGVFPDYQQILPKKFTADVVVKNNDFTNALKSTAMFSGKLNELVFSLNPEENFIVLKTANNEIGDCVVKIPAKITGEKIKITFNHRYIQDCLQAVNNNDILLRFCGEMKPLLITSLNNNTFQYLVMPMSI
ncbi:MAG: DNA polymerase III subunit beta [Candidatus Pacebacteria bacterium]|nr:DNA polymerase III subunit beta [Candidatus Paceibacterota bacterium]NUQ56912.1 DNA polymerase III subunit beta [Candidatus Paceibacter sp.]